MGECHFASSSGVESPELQLLTINLFPLLSMETPRNCPPFNPNVLAVITREEGSMPPGGAGHTQNEPCDIIVHFVAVIVAYHRMYNILGFK